jgi:hypothetical protein
VKLRIGRSDGNESADASPLVVERACDLDLTPAEVKQLRLFVRGAMMDLGVREHLWRSWGFCPRHTWAHAIVEVELVGGLPFGTAILYEDLAGELRALARRLHVFVKSLTVDGPTATDEDRAAWVEALGFFAGWQVPLALSRV